MPQKNWPYLHSCALSAEGMVSFPFLVFSASTLAEPELALFRAAQASVRWFCRVSFPRKEPQGGDILATLTRDRGTVCRANPDQDVSGVRFKVTREGIIGIRPIELERW